MGRFLLLLGILCSLVLSKSEDDTYFGLRYLDFDANETDTFDSLIDNNVTDFDIGTDAPSVAPTENVDSGSGEPGAQPTAPSPTGSGEPGAPPTPPISTVAYPPTSEPTAFPSPEDIFQEEIFEDNVDQFGDKIDTTYVPKEGDDPFAEVPDVSGWGGEGDWPQETPEEMLHDRNVGILVASIVVVSLLLMFLLSVYISQQLIDNPDGCCASLCRCCVNCFCCVFRVVCFPLAICCPRKRGHEQLATDYSHDLELS